MFGDPMTNSKHWTDYELLKDVTEIVLGSTPNSKNPKYWDGTINWITPAELSEQSYFVYDTERHITKEGFLSANLTIMPIGTVLFSTRAPIGKVAITGQEMCCNQGFKNFVCSNRLNNVFLYYTLKFKKDYLCSLGTGTTFKELSKKVIETLRIAVPPIELQNEFEQIYNQADKSGFVASKSRFIEMFGTISDPKVSVKRLIDVVEKSGQYGSNTPATDYISNTPRYIRITDINDDGSLNNDVKSPSEIDSKYMLIPGDVVFARTGATVGKTYLHKAGHALYAGYLIKYHTNNAMLPDFLFAFTHSAMYKQWIAKTQKIGAQPNISATQYDSMPILVPSIAEQMKYVELYNQADKSGLVN
jgi:type I restriction enzyme S subunit